MLAPPSPAAPMPAMPTMAGIAGYVDFAAIRDLAVAVAETTGTPPDRAATAAAPLGMRENWAGDLASAAVIGIDAEIRLAPVGGISVAVGEVAVTGGDRAALGRVTPGRGMVEVARLARVGAAAVLGRVERKTAISAGLGAPATAPGGTGVAGAGARFGGLRADAPRDARPDVGGGAPHGQQRRQQAQDHPCPCLPPDARAKIRPGGIGASVGHVNAPRDSSDPSTDPCMNLSRARGRAARRISAGRSFPRREARPPACSKRAAPTRPRRP